MTGESLTSNARRALPTRNRFTKPSKEKPSPVGRASSPSRTNLFGLRAREAATISGKAEVRLLPVLDCKKMFSSSRKTRQRNPSHFGSYIHSLPMGKLFTATAGVSCSHFASRYSKWAFSRRCCNFDSLYSARVEEKNARYKEILAQDSPN